MVGNGSGFPSYNYWEVYSHFLSGRFMVFSKKFDYILFQELNGLHIRYYLPPPLEERRHD